MDRMAVRLKGVGKRYKHFSLEGVDLEVARGRALGVVGQNGAGKSTLLRIVMGLVRADGGTVEVLGRAMPAEERAIKREVGFVSEDMALYRGATLRWHMDLVRSFYPGWDEAYAAALLDRFELNASQRMGGMSRGQQVKAMLLLALATVTGYLLAIARNLHRQGFARTRRQAELEHEPADPQPDPHRAAEDRDELAAVLADMRDLSETERAALLMRAAAETPYTEIAAALGISEGAAKVKVHRARLKLAEARLRRQGVTS